MTTGSAHYPPAAMCLSASSVSANYVHTVYTLFLALACALRRADSPSILLTGRSITISLPSAQACFENLAHSHLVVSTSTAAVLVDPHFRDQFLITAPSVRYAAALECVPEEFVGGSSRLTALVEFLSGVTFCAYVGCPFVDVCQVLETRVHYPGLCAMV